MRRLRLGFGVLATAAWLAAAGCGESTGGAGPSAGAGQASGGDAGSTSASGATSAGGSKAGSGSSSSGSAQGGSTSGTGSGDGGTPAETEGGGPSGGLVDCDARKVLCKLLPSECPALQVHAVEGTCWGDCVKIDQCACSTAADCPDANQYTCWAGEHCGPYVN